MPISHSQPWTSSTVIQAIPRYEPLFIPSWHLCICLRTCSTITIKSCSRRVRAMGTMSPISLKTTTSTPIFSNTQRGSTWRALRYCQQPAPKLNRWVLVAQCILLFVNSALISLVRSGTLSWTNNEDLLYCTFGEPTSVFACFHANSSSSQAPLSPVITHEVKAFITHEDHLWTGPPDPKTEEKWHQVLQGRCHAVLPTGCLGCYSLE